MKIFSYSLQDFPNLDQLLFVVSKIHEYIILKVFQTGAVHIWMYLVQNNFSI